MVFVRQMPFKKQVELFILLKLVERANVCTPNTEAILGTIR